MVRFSMDSLLQKPLSDDLGISGLMMRNAQKLRYLQIFLDIDAV